MGTGLRRCGRIFDVSIGPPSPIESSEWVCTLGPSTLRKPSSSSGPTEWPRPIEGVHGQFLKLVTDEPRVDVELRRFLSEGYKLNAIADYETGPDAVVQLGQAATAVETAGRFIDPIAELLT